MTRATLCCVLSLPLVIPALSGARCAAADLPVVALRSGESYFRVDGRPSFLLGRNPTGWQTEQLIPLLDWSAESGERIARLHVTIGWPMGGAPGEVDEAWAARWDGVLDAAAVRGVYVLPVLGVWGQWNDGAHGEAWHYWDQSSYNASRGGPAQTPAELLRESSCQRLWLAWLDALVRRWASRHNVLGWEVFSELDLITGATEAAVVAFVERAAQVIRAADPDSRPITASLSGTQDWPHLSASDALDFIQVHPYGANLCDLLLGAVRDRLQRYGKAVFIGECGLSADPPAKGLASAPGAPVGLNHALWASVVSGAMNGRMFWWEDGYDQYEGLDLRTQYRHASQPVARFVEGVDFTGMKPVQIETSPGVVAAALGNDHTVLAWFRDASCSAPDWPLRTVEGATARVVLPAGQHSMTLYDTQTGEVLSTGPADPSDLRLPPFRGSIALKLTR